MSEKKDTPNGAPIGTQRSGSNGERRDSEAVELSPQAEASERSLSRRVSRETPTPPQRNKPSSFYIYLVVLFGAAFLMLLLAYFVQRRNNETVQDNLRTTIASREELVEDIQRLEGESLELLKQNEALMAQLTDLQAENAELEAQLEAARNDPVIAEQKNRADVLTSFAILEQALRDKNYEIAANRVRTLCQGNLNLDLGLVNLDGTEYFHPRARLAEIIPLLEKTGALAPGEVAVPGAAASDG